MHSARRRFAQELGGALALAVLPRAVAAHDRAHEIEVRIARFAYRPARIEIFVGDSIVWVNDDLAPHTATADDAAWGTGPLDRGGARRITLEAAGEHPYFCGFHPHMKGLVVVRSKAGG